MYLKCQQSIHVLLFKDGLGSLTHGELVVKKVLNYHLGLFPSDLG